MDGISEAMNDSISYVSATMYLSRKTKLSSVARILPAGILSILTVCISTTLASNSKSPALIILYLVALTSLSGLGTIGAIIVCKIQISNQDRSDNEKSDSFNDSLTSTNNKVTPIKITDEERNPATLDLDNPPKKSIQRERKKNVCCNYRRLDNIFLGLLCVTFIIFSIIFAYYFHIR